MKFFILLSLILLLTEMSLGQSAKFEAMLERAEQGDVDAQNEAGIMYSEGKGVKKNQKKAVYWFRRSAENGYAIGTCNLGLHYGWGWGVRKNKTLMMKYIFAANVLDGLKCQPTDFIEHFKPTRCQIEYAWRLAIEWLRSHSDFKNNFGDKPWMDSDGEYPETVRENGPTTKLPIEQTRRCIRHKKTK